MATLSFPKTVAESSFHRAISPHRLKPRHLTAISSSRSARLMRRSGRHFVALREQLGAKVRGFADMTAEEVAELTGLSHDEALLWLNSVISTSLLSSMAAPDERFLQAIEDAGLQLDPGADFPHSGQSRQRSCRENSRSRSTSKSMAKSPASGWVTALTTCPCSRRSTVRC